MKPSTLLSGSLAASSSGAVSNPSTSKIDVHAHFIPDFYAQALRDAGHIPGPDGMPAIPAWDPDTHLNFMHAQNITKAYLSISSPGVYLTVPSTMATNNATRLARQVNEYASRLKAQHPHRFGFFASLPLPDIQAALDEIHHCFHELDPKPDGVVLMSNYYGMYLGDPALSPVFKALDELNATVFEHPTTPCTEHNHVRFHTTGEAPLVAQKEWQALNRPVSNRQFAAPTLDFPFDTARTFADLLYSKVPGRFARIKWIIPHAGGGLIPTLDRVVGYSSLYPGLNLTQAFVRETLARSFYFDLAGPWPARFAIPSLVRWVNYTNIVWGSDTPFTPWAVAAAGISAFDRDAEEVFGGDAEKSHAVRFGNAHGLFESLV
ncbi:amidohydrolase 2, partial [Metarhizium majus ARSEF 297]